MFCFSLLPLRQLKFIGQGRRGLLATVAGGVTAPPKSPTHDCWVTPTERLKLCWGLPPAAEKYSPPSIEQAGSAGELTTFSQWATRAGGSLWNHGFLDPLQRDSSEACSKPSPEALRGIEPRLPTELRCSLQHPEELPSFPVLFHHACSVSRNHLLNELLALGFVLFLRRSN